MEPIELESHLRPLSYAEMVEIEGGFPWAAVLIGLGCSFLVNLPEFVNGVADGWYAYHN